MGKHKTREGDGVAGQDRKLEFKYSGQRGPSSKGDLPEKMWTGQRGKLCGYGGKTSASRGNNK